MKSISILLFILPIFVFSQINRVKNWHFGENTNLKFNDTGLALINDSKLYTTEGCSSISDDLGNLILYTDGKTLWNKYNKVVKNGSGLLGDESSTQSALIINHVENDSLYYIFTTPYSYSYNIGLNYSIVNINKNNDSGEVILKNQKLNTNSSEKICAVYHKNGKDIWIMGHEFGNNRFFSYLLNNNGINSCPVYSNEGFSFKNYEAINQGYLKFSIDGSMIVNTYLFDLNNSYIEVFNYNNELGKCKFKKQISNIVFAYGAEFSSNNKYLYLTEENKLVQISLDSWIKRDLIICKSNQFNAIQYGANNKIYFSQNDSNYIGVINFPNKKVFNSEISFQKLNNGLSKLGLPNFNQSYFFTPSINYSYELDCINNNILFEGYDTFSATVHQWDIKKTYSLSNYTNVANTKNMNYAFADTGTYNVRFIASTSTSSVFDTILKTITIYPKINKNFLGKDTTYSQGSIINKTLKSPQPSHCQVWQDSSGLSTYTATKKGIYTCKVTNNAFCEVMDTIEIKECLNLTQPSIYHSNKGDTLFCNHIIADTFIWFKNDVVYKTTTTNNTNESFIKLTDTGTYRVEAIKYNHCNRSSSNFRINKLSINNLTLQNFNIKVYPNPSEGLIWIESDNSFKLQIIDILGKEIKSLDSPKMLTLPLGFYFFKFQIGEVVVTEKVVVL